MAPTYTYACACGYSVDVMHPMSVKRKRVLCVCCDKPMHKQIGPGSGIIFRGAGFHAVDYSNDHRIRKGQK